MKRIWNGKASSKADKKMMYFIYFIIEGNYFILKIYSHKLDYVLSFFVNS